MLRGVAMLLLLAACQGVPGRSQRVVTLADVVDERGEGRVDLEVRGDGDVLIELGGSSLIVEVALRGPPDLEATLQSDAGVAGETSPGVVWFRPTPYHVDSLELSIYGRGAPVVVTVWARGSPVPRVDVERSLLWRSEMLDDPQLISFAKLMEVASVDGHGGELLYDWFSRFSTTAFSIRTRPLQWLEQAAAGQGPDPSLWDLERLPFQIESVHNRLDLWGGGATCGELHVTASTLTGDPYELHLLFLFAQKVQEDDIGPSGQVHCRGTARRWGRLSQLSEADFAEAAKAWLDEKMVHQTFLLAESSELDGDWEWRQWVPTPGGPQDALPAVWSNPPLFQTVSVEDVNAPGTLHEDFIAWVEANAGDVFARRAVVPAAFRSRAVRLSIDNHWPQLDLRDLDQGIRESYPTMVQQIEMIGCTGCHTAPETRFVQTERDREISAFQLGELRARADLIDAMNEGAEVEVPSFGPLQDF